MKERAIKRYIGPRSFYRRAFAVMLPLALQNVVTNFVSLLDNIMIGQTGTASMSGVAVVGQLMFIFYIFVFGTMAGPGIFCAQFWGAGDMRSFKAAFRFRLAAGLIVCAICMLALGLRGRPLVGLYLTGGAAETAEVMDHALSYLRIMLWGMLPYTLSSIYASTLRETGRTVVPMVSSLAAVAVNLALNWILIFGKLGAPAMGVRGAAIATVVSRLCELVINLAWCHANSVEIRFTRRMLEGFPMSRRLFLSLLSKSIPLMANEALWCLGMATLTQIYSTRGLVVVAALNIANVLWDLFSSLIFSTGGAIGIMVGQELGAGETELAVETDRRLIALAAAISLCVSGVFLLAAPLFPSFYNTSAEVRALAARIIRVMALVEPFDCFATVCYFTIRSGGRTAVTFLFDSVFTWAFCVPAAFLLARFTSADILVVYGVSMMMIAMKALMGYVMVRGRFWVNTLTGG